MKFFILFVSFQTKIYKKSKLLLTKNCVEKFLGSFCLHHCCHFGSSWGRIRKSWCQGLVLHTQIHPQSFVLQIQLHSKHILHLPKICLQISSKLCCVSLQVIRITQNGLQVINIPNSKLSMHWIRNKTFSNWIKMLYIFFTKHAKVNGNESWLRFKTRVHIYTR